MAKRTKRKVRKNVVRAIVHIKATFNNTLITVMQLRRAQPAV
jgi:ribosomal protein S11